MMILFIVSSVAAVDVNGPVAPPKVKSFENAGFASVSSPSQVSAIVYSPKAGFNSGTQAVTATPAGTAVSSGGVVQAQKVQQNPNNAPINPDYTAYLKKLSTNQRGKNYGYVPSPIADPEWKGVSVPTASGGTYASRYITPVSSVKDQGACNSGWAFATMGSLEGYLIRNTWTNNWDLSENSLKNDNNFDLGPCGGGNNNIATGALSRWLGPYYESQNPYTPYVVKSTLQNTGTLQYVAECGTGSLPRVQDVYYIPSSATAPNLKIKDALQLFGPVTAAFYYNESAYDAVNSTYYYNGDETVANHMVAIVGWDDNYSAAKFKGNPPHNGAWIVKNSWGKSWGTSIRSSYGASCGTSDKGFFYVSYDDKIMGTKDMAAYTVKKDSPYKWEYQYDLLGRTNQLGCNSNTAWAANVFTSTHRGSLKAVSSFFAMPQSQYSLDIYLNMKESPVTDPRNGTLVLNQSGMVEWPGYHTINLKNNIPVSSGQTFSVVIRYTTPGYNNPIPNEVARANYSSKSLPVGAGYCFYSWDGSVWHDWNGAKGKNILKVFQG